MLSALKNFFGWIHTAVTYVKAIRTIRGWIADYPGMTSGPRLREWLRRVVNDISVLASQSSFQFDDAVVTLLRQLIDNDVIWSILNESIRLICGEKSLGDAAIPGGATALYGSGFSYNNIDSYTTRDPSHRLTETAESMQLGNPTLILAAIGLLLQIVRFIHEQKRNTKEMER
jgi:hypothetical protein